MLLMQHSALGLLWHWEFGIGADLLTKRKEDYMVSIGLLRVIIIKEDEETYFAHGLEFHYAAEGVSVEDVKKRFLAGLREMFSAKRPDDVALIMPRHPMIWSSLLRAASSSVCPHADFAPYEGIHWFECF